MSEDNGDLPAADAEKSDPNSTDFIKILIIIKVLVVLVVAVIAVILFKTI